MTNRPSPEPRPLAIRAAFDAAICETFGRDLDEITDDALDNAWSRFQTNQRAEAMSDLSAVWAEIASTMADDEWICVGGPYGEDRHYSASLYRRPDPNEFPDGDKRPRDRWHAGASTPEGALRAAADRYLTAQEYRGPEYHTEAFGPSPDTAYLNDRLAAGGEL